MATSEHGTVKRYRSGCKCRPCRDIIADQENARRATRGISSRFDPDPLYEVLNRRAFAKGKPVHVFAASLGLNADTLCSAISRGNPLNWDTVDRFCCALGFHPTALYPEFVLYAAA